MSEDMEAGSSFPKDGDRLAISSFLKPWEAV